MPDASGPSADSVLAALLQALDEGALVFDATGVCRAVGRRAADVLGVEVAAILGVSRPDFLGAVANATDHPDVLAPLDQGVAGPDSGERTVVEPIDLARPIALGPPRAPRSGHYPRTLAWTSVPLAGTAEAPQGRLDLIRDVTRERRAERTVEELSRRLETESTTDDVTGLVNRRRFDEECLREHRRAQREWVTYAIASIDVDGMTEINERDGRARGDALLRRIGEELRASRREYDVVARGEHDTFVILLPRADARALGSVLRRAIESVHAAGRAIAPGMSVCVGAAIWTPPSAEGPGDILRRAESALATARARGQGKVEVDLGASEWKDEV
jgi:diguanylate cyclase (GGDEF)-like protein